MSEIKLDEYEQEILDSYAADEFKSVLTPERINQVMRTAENTLSDKTNESMA